MSGKGDPCVSHRHVPPRCPPSYWEAMQVEPTIPGFTPMNVALVILQCLHVFWFVLIVRAVNKVVKGGGVEDTRETDVDSDSD